MEHKAFIFDYAAFELELKSILEAALDRNDTQSLKDFIDSNFTYLKHPDEGDSLADNWEESIEYKEPHHYGDIALTKFYDPAEDIGLGYVGYDWVEIEDAVSNDSDNPILILGKPIGKEDNYFDPGRMSSYFQSLDMVVDNRHKINLLTKDKSLDTKYSDPIVSILDLAIASKKGLYITF